MKKWYWTSIILMLFIGIYVIFWLDYQNWIQIFLGTFFGYVAGITIGDWENNRKK